MSATGFMSGSALDTHPRICREQTTGATGIAPESAPTVIRSWGIFSPHPVDGMRDAWLDQKDVARLDYVTSNCILPEVWSSVNWSSLTPAIYNALGWPASASVKISAQSASV